MSNTNELYRWISTSSSPSRRHYNHCLLVNDNMTSTENMNQLHARTSLSSSMHCALDHSIISISSEYERWRGQEYRSVRWQAEDSRDEQKGSNHSNCEDWQRLCRHGGICVWLWRGKIHIFWKRMVQVRKMVACLENTDYSSCLKLTVTRGVLGKELATMNWS